MISPKNLITPCASRLSEQLFLAIKPKEMSLSCNVLLFFVNQPYNFFFHLNTSYILARQESCIKKVLNMAIIFEDYLQQVGYSHLFNNNTLTLANTGMTDETASMFFMDLHEVETFPENLTIDLSFNSIGTNGVKTLAHLLMFGLMPKGLHINLESNPITCEDLYCLSAAISESDKKIDNLTLNLGGCNLGDEGFEIWAFTLKLYTLADGLTLILYDNNSSLKGISSFADALSGHVRTKNLTLNFCSAKIGKEGAKLFANALSSKNSAKGLTLGLDGNNIGDEGAQALSEMLSSNNAPEGLTLLLFCNGITDRGAQYFADAIRSEKLPKGLTLDLDANNFTQKGINILVDAILQEKHPSDLKIIGYKSLDDALEIARKRIINRLVSTGITLYNDKTDNKKNDSKKSRFKGLGLPLAISTEILSYLDPCGKTIGENINRFFYLKTIVKTPLKEQGIDIDKANNTLGIANANMLIEGVLNYYFMNTSLSLHVRKQRVESFLTSLNKIDKNEHETRVLDEISRCQVSAPI